MRKSEISIQDRQTLLAKKRGGEEEEEEGIKGFSLSLSLMYLGGGGRSRGMPKWLKLLPKRISSVAFPSGTTAVHTLMD